MAGRDDVLVKVQPLLERVDDVASFLATAADPVIEHALAKGQSVGRPLMDDEQLARLETQLHQRLLPARRGRPPTGNRQERQTAIEFE